MTNILKIDSCAIVKIWKSEKLSHRVVTWPLLKSLLDVNIFTPTDVQRNCKIVKARCYSLSMLKEDLSSLYQEGIDLDQYLQNQGVKIAENYVKLQDHELYDRGGLEDLTITWELQ